MFIVAYRPLSFPVKCGIPKKFTVIVVLTILVISRSWGPLSIKLHLFLVGRQCQDYILGYYYFVYFFSFQEIQEVGQ